MKIFHAKLIPFPLLLLALFFILNTRGCNCIAIAPSTFGGAIARAGKISNTLKNSAAWKTLIAHPNSLAQIFPGRAMRMVQKVVTSFRKDTYAIVSTNAGKLRGRYQKFRSGDQGGFYSFKGIRYGEPPIGSRRFRCARPEKPWNGLRDALREGNSCPHKNMILGTFKGKEDCLFLNVFTSKLPNELTNPKMSVMVWLHGGGFSFGSGNSFMYGPDYLVAEDVVVVTINYRLGALGFLSASPDAPGNQGLKDQVLALKWVKNNILAFGGDPDSITIFGESAGASSVQFLLLSPMAKGLFHRGISQSGSALNPWSITRNSKERAYRLASYLGYSGNLNNTNEFINFLRRVPAMSLVEAAPNTLTTQDIRNSIGLPFVPSVEGFWNNFENSSGDGLYLEPPFITEDPEKMYQNGLFNDVPYLSGFNSHEAILFIRRLRKYPDLLQVINNDFARLVPQDLNVTTETQHVSQRIREFYHGSKNISAETIDETIYLLTDLMFLRGILKSARIHAKRGTSPIFFYRFAFDGSLGLYKRILGISRPGVCHGDELGYLFKFGFFNFNLDPASIEVVVKNRLVKMWSNFAKFGNPTPDERDTTILPTRWEPVNPNDVLHNFAYLDITSNLEMKSNPEAERQTFWDKIYTHYNGNAI